MEQPSVVASCCLVIPCHDEQDRLDPDAIGRLAGDPRITILLVDDGSTDATPDLLGSLASSHPSVDVVTLGANVGKGEAVRAGFAAARDRGTEWVGFVDADGSTPPEEILRLLDLATARDDLSVVLGARVALLGRRITRSAFRHYSGRVFATFASLVLDIPVYDTQCGAKLFRSAPALDAAIASPFRSRWAFDVELLGRLLRTGTTVEEIWEIGRASCRERV